MGDSQEDDRRIWDEASGDLSEDEAYRNYVRQKIERGLQDVEAGRVVTQEEVERRTQQWFRT